MSSRLSLVALSGCWLASTASAAATGTNSGSVVVYVGIGIIVLLFLLAAFLVWRCKRNRRCRRATTVGYAPQSASNAFRLEIGEGQGAQLHHQQQAHHHHHQQQQIQQQPSRKHSHVTAAANNRFERAAQLESVELDAFQDARSDYDLEPADLYFPFGPSAGPVSDYIGSAAEYEQRPYQHPNERTQQQPSNIPSYSRNGHYAGDRRVSAAQSGNASGSIEPLHPVLEELADEPTLEGQRVDYSALYFTRVLSKGAFGEVWLGQVKSRQVAIKRILKERRNDEKEIECFAAEIKLMASFSHPKIVEFVGVAWTNITDLCAITEYMAKGDLYGFLQQHIGKLNWRDHKIFLAEDVADAIGYLHSLSPKVIHRDLKSKNILLDDAFRAKLSDFGISRERSVEDTMTAGVGTIYWTAPEVLMGKKYTEKADIYSFGIVMSELDTHQVPYSDKRDDSGKKLQGMKIVQMVIKRNVRPTLASDCPWQVSDLIKRCVDVDPSVRPSASELLSQVRIIADELD